MKGKIFIGRSRELEALHKSLRKGSAKHALLVAGDKGMGKSALLDQYWQDLRSSGSPALWINLNRLSTLREPGELTTALVQSLDGSTSALQAQVASFAQSFGQAIFASEQDDETESQELSPEQRLALLWTKEFLHAFPLAQDSSSKPLVYVAMDDLDKVRANLLGWFNDEFISKWKELGILDSFRFIATSTTWPLAEGSRRFIESVADHDPLLVRIDPLSPQECEEFARKRGASEISGTELFSKTKGIPSQVEDELEMHSVTRTPFPSDKEAGSMPNGLTDRQTHWICRAACLPSITIEGLKLFYDSKEAAEAFNWLRYASKVTNSLPDRALGLDSATRQAALNLIRKEDPAGSQSALNRAERFAHFQERVPDDTERRMLLLLSNFLFFDKEALEAIVGPETPEFMKFVKRRSEWFIKTTHNYQMLPEYREICQSFRELLGESAADVETKQKISTCWGRKKESNTNLKDQLLAEQAKYREEMSSVDEQCKSLESARDQMLSPGPKSVTANKNNKRRQVTIGTSMSFIILGVSVLALSLGFRDLFSPYHAAAGIFLTLAGFFWPMVTQQSLAAARTSGMDQFAVETQQRVLQFRLNGLGTRRSKLRESLGTIHRETSNLDEILEEPYLLTD